MGDIFSSEVPELLLTHLEQLSKGSGIAINIIQERGYRSILGRKELQELGFSRVQCRTPGLLIPLWSVDGQRVGYVYRPDTPRINAKGKPIKYENPAGSSIRLDCPPRCKPMLGDPSVPVFFVEGSKKADALASQGACAIALNGIWGFKGKNPLGGVTLLADFDYIALEGREVFVVYDSDYATNPQVRKALNRLLEHLKRKGAIASAIYLPPKPDGGKQGVDDFLAAGHTLDDIKALAAPLQQEAEEKERQSLRSYLYYNNRLYLEVRKFDGSYAFVYLDDEGKAKFAPEVIVGEQTIKPRPLPQVEGKTLAIVGMPDEDIVYSPLLASNELSNELEAHFRQYIDLPDLDLHLCVYYCLFTWFYPKTNTLGFLRFRSDTGKGKSRMQRVVGDVCFYPLYASGASSFSGMARQQDKWQGTLVVDESDFQGEKESQITKYFNLGFERGKYYILSDKQNPGRQDFFDPYCPKILAMRTTFKDNALERRLLSISPHETTNPLIPIILLSDYSERAQKLRNKIALFVLHRWNDVDGEKMLSFDDLKLEPGLKQLAMPLSIIFQLWQDGAQSFREYLATRQQEIKKLRSQSWEGSLFNLIYSIAVGDFDLEEEFAAYYEPQSKKIEAVTPTMVARQMRSTTRAVSDGLTSIGFEVERKAIIIHSKDDEADRKRVIRGYVVPNEKAWDEMVARYYYQEGEDEENIKVPDVLRSRKFVSVKASIASKVSTEPLITHFVDAVDEFDASAHTEKKDSKKATSSATPRLPDGRVVNWAWCLSTWDSIGRPVIHAGDNDNIFDLSLFLFPERVSPKRLGGIVNWLEEHSGQKMPVG